MEDHSILYPFQSKRASGDTASSAAASDEPPIPAVSIPPPAIPALSLAASASEGGSLKKKTVRRAKKEAEPPVSAFLAERGALSPEKPPAQSAA